LVPPPAPPDALALDVAAFVPDAMVDRLVAVALPPSPPIPS
jgi:hypothetical protein